MEPKRFEFIDCLRGLALIMVFMHHCGIMIGTPFFGEIGKAIIHNARYGVLLFFMVSAYALLLSLESRKDEKYWLRNFFIRRFFRIAPLYWMALLFYTLTNVIGFRFFMTGIAANPIDWGKFLSNLFFVHSFRADWINSYVPGGWSIGVEVIFYLMLPFLFIQITDINKCIRYLFAALLFCMVLRYLFLFPFFDWNLFLWFYLPAQLPIFMLGLLSYFTHKDGWQRLNNSTLAIITTGVMLACYFTPPYYFLYCLIFYLLIVLLSRKNYRLLVNPVLAYLGKISYSMYLSHFMVMHVLGYFRVFNFLEITNFWTSLLSFLLRLFATLILSGIISSVSYVHIEKRFEIMGKKLIKKLPV